MSGNAQQEVQNAAEHFSRDARLINVINAPLSRIARNPGPLRFRAKKMSAHMFWKWWLNWAAFYVGDCAEEHRDVLNDALSQWQVSPRPS